MHSRCKRVKPVCDVIISLIQDSMNCNEGIIMNQYNLLSLSIVIRVSVSEACQKQDLGVFSYCSKVHNGCGTLA